MQFQQAPIKVSSGSTVQYKIDLGNGQRLIAVEAVEVDANIRQVYDLVNIGLVTADPGALSVNLKTGHIGVNNSLVWQGDVPVQQPLLLLVTFGQPPNGAQCIVRYLTLALGEIGGGMGASANIVQHYPIGRPVVGHVTQTADALVAPLQPPAGFQWLLQHAEGEIDDAVSRNCRWEWYDGTNSDPIGAPALLNSAERYPFGMSYGLATYVHTGALGALATRLVYPRFTADALTAGKHLTIGYCVLEFAGGV
jgi:hypothetical protein